MSKIHLIDLDDCANGSLCGLYNHTLVFEETGFIEDHPIFEGEHGKKLRAMFLTSPHICKNCFNVYMSRKARGKK